MLATGRRVPLRWRAMDPDQLVLLPLWYAVFLLSVTCHEAGHAFVAYRGGDSTAYLGGQVTLNPLPHIQREPFGTVLIPMLSYLMMGFMMGWASAPYDPQWEERHPRRASAMAAAGPAANLILLCIGFVVLKAGLAAQIWQPAMPESLGFDRLVVVPDGGAIEGLGRFCSLLVSLNLLLVVLNLIPLPPLDGSAIVAGLVPAARRLRDQLRASGIGGLAGLLIAVYSLQYLFTPLFRIVLRWLHPGYFM